MDTVTENTTKTTALNWFELFVDDMERARSFYETIFQTKLERVEGMAEMALFAYKPGSGVGGALTKMEKFKPGPGGTIVYLNAEGELDGIVSRIEPAGGKIVRPRFAIPPHGFIALFEDTEGNIVGLHSMS